MASICWSSGWSSERYWRDDQALVRHVAPDGSTYDTDLPWVSDIGDIALDLERVKTEDDAT
jgi:hypothetical protein